MLLSNDNTYYIGGKQVAEMYMNGSQLYKFSTASDIVNGNNFDNYSWAEIKTICNAQEASNYFALGDTVTVPCGSYGNVTFRVILLDGQVTTTDYQHGMTLLATAPVSNVAWGKYHSYTNSAIDDELDNFKLALPDDLRGAIETTYTIYNSSADNPTTTSGYNAGLFILCQKEMFPSSYYASSVAGMSKTQLLPWFAAGNIIDLPEGTSIWTRDAKWSYSTNNYHGVYYAGTDKCVLEDGTSAIHGVLPCFSI